MRRPEANEYGPSHAGYVNLVPETDIVGVLTTQPTEIETYLATIDDERALHRYAPGKWSIKDVLGHIADSEHIFGYRLLAFARGETQPLPGFDQEIFASNVKFDDWPLGDIAGYLASTRRTNLNVIRNLDEAAWKRAGIASEYPVSVLGIAFILAGHVRHHLGVLREKYA